MAARLLSGKALAASLHAELQSEVAAWASEHGRTPTLAAVLVGDDAASAVYVRNKQRACQKVGLRSQLHRIHLDAGIDALLRVVADLNRDPVVDGILVQLPLPSGWQASRVLDAVDPTKDVDAFHPENVGLLLQGRPRFLPCTPHGIQQLLIRNQIPIAGRHVVVVGRSDIVGKPLAGMLVQRDSPYGPDAVNATVTICHRHTHNLSDVTRSADILVAAVGQARLITADMVRPGAVVVDVGINRVGEQLVGDVDFDEVSGVAGAITPVPGGVGPLTIAMLLRNTLDAAQSREAARQLT